MTVTNTPALPGIIPLNRRSSCPLRQQSSSHQQDDQHDQKDGTKTAADIRAADVEAAAAEQDQQYDDENDRVHDGNPPKLIMTPTVSGGDGKGKHAVRIKPRHCCGHAAASADPGSTALAARDEPHPPVPDIGVSSA
jgi:hypothetical protein